MKGLLLAWLLLLPLMSAAAPQGTDSKPGAAITNGPVLEGTSATTAVIAWTTSVNAGTTVRYGTDRGHLDRIAEMPWGGITHRVHLKGLKPGTTYYYRVSSMNAQGSGRTLESEVLSFTTQEAPGRTGN